MTQPYFSVGEIVILVSPRFPDYNGEYVIEDIVFGFKYILGGLYIPEGVKGVDGKTWSGYTKRSSLRKKYEPPEDNESFSEMLDNLDKVVVEI